MFWIIVWSLISFVVGFGAGYIAANLFGGIGILKEGASLLGRIFK